MAVKYHKYLHSTAIQCLLVEGAIQLWVEDVLVALIKLPTIKQIHIYVNTTVSYNRSLSNVILETYINSNIYSQNIVTFHA